MAYSEKKAKETMLKGMNEIVLHLNNENAITPWLVYGVPDGAEDVEIERMAADDTTFDDCAKVFLQIMQKKTAYEDGICIGRRVISADGSRDKELEYIKAFAGGEGLRVLQQRWQLRALWTAYCFHKRLDTDSFEYDQIIGEIWNMILSNEASKGDWKDYDEFDNFMCELLV